MEENKRGKRIYFTTKDDLEMLGLVIDKFPFLDSKQWPYIAELLRQRRGKRFTAKNVRDRVNHLITHFRLRDHKRIVRSGEEEGLAEIDQMLEEASDLKAEAERNPSKKRKTSTVLANDIPEERGTPDPLQSRISEGDYELEVNTPHGQLASLREDKQYKLQLLAVEKMKAENEKIRADNERMKLTMEDAKMKNHMLLENKRMELEETKLTNLQEHFRLSAEVNAKMLQVLEAILKKIEPSIST